MKRCNYILGCVSVLMVFGNCVAEEDEQTLIEGTEFIEGDTLENVEKEVDRAPGEETIQQEYIPRLPSGRIPRQPLPRNQIQRNPLPRQSIPRVRLPDNRVPRESLPRNRIPRNRIERRQIERNPLPRSRIPRNPLPRASIRDERRELEEELYRENNQ